MGNCQAIDAAALVIQHPCGRIERLYWPVPAREIMRLNPGHYVSLIIPLNVSGGEENQSQQGPKTVQFTRVKLLRPSDTLALGHAYRLVTTEEVMKVLKAKKYAKAKRQQPEPVEKSQVPPEKQSLDSETGKKSGREKDYQLLQAVKQERHRPRAAAVNSAALRSKAWRPSLQSIEEVSS